MRGLLPFALVAAACSANSSTGLADGGAGGAAQGGAGGAGGVGGGPPGHITYSVEDEVFRIEAVVGATPENVSEALGRFGRGGDTWLMPSRNGEHLALVTSKTECSNSSCLAVTDAAFSFLATVRPGGTEVSVLGASAINNAGDTVVYPGTGGPHDVDLFLTTKSDDVWSEPVLLTGDSTFPFNNTASITFDETRVLFECGFDLYPDGPAPESEGTAACEVKLDGSGFRVVVDAMASPDAGTVFLQFPHDSLDGVLFQGSWPIDGETTQSIWLMPPEGEPLPASMALGRASSPCGLNNGRFGALWLDGPDNLDGRRELTLIERDGTVAGVLTPGVSVYGAAIGCSD